MNETILLKTLQAAIALGLLNVWLIRFNKVTAFRGADANNMIEEFKAYGLSKRFCYFTGILKVGSAISLLLGLWIPSFTLPAAIVITILMVGAILMHIKVKDSIKKTFPATIMFIMSAIVSVNYL